MTDLANSGANLVAEFEPRKPGRPKGSPDRKRVMTQEQIAKTADPLGFWLRVAKGRPVQIEAGYRGKRKVMHQPTPEQVFLAQERLLRKIMPDLKATELTGADGGPVAVTLLDFLRGLPE